MAMVKVTNGKDEMLISKSVFRQMYERLGWKLKEESEEQLPEDTTINPDELELDENKTNNAKEENEPEDNVDKTENEYECSDDTNDELPLEEKPLREMTLEELKEYAKIKEVDIKGLETSKEIKKAIRKALTEE